MAQKIINRKYLIQVIFLLSVLFSTQACDIETGIDTIDENNNSPEETFSSIEENVFRPRCALSGCHNSGTKSANLDLSTANAYTNLVNIKSILSTQGLKRVEPGNSSASFLIKVLDGSDPTRMPLSSAPLSDSTINVISKWIDDGALNN